MRILNHDRGVSASSYGLVVGLISIVALAAVTSSGSSIEQLFTDTSDTLEGVLDGSVGQSASAGDSSASPTPTPVFGFASHTFTTCGASGQFGPSEANCTSAYSTSWDEDPANFNVTGGIQFFTVPQTGTYRITAIGASGGDSGHRAAGNGASMRGDFDLTVGTVLRIVVGQEGSASTNDSLDFSGGGGGGTFVSSNGTSNLLIAAGGGGGGAGRYNNSLTEEYTGMDAVTGTAGTAGNSPVSASIGTSDNGSRGYSPGRLEFTSHNGVAGGGGWLESAIDGHNSSEGGHAGNSDAQGGGAGEGGVGGFGGGGGGRNVAGGGGGGYSGGNGGVYFNGGSTYSAGGGGGGSFNGGTNQSNQAGANDGHGSVIIELL
ncbi:MAG: hypothetical protein Alpg2KO_15920 [Alphaproteobacteria bacterium]